jgi:SET domain-containing protein
MLLVKTKIGPSEISGIGLFADEFIPKGTPTWKFMPGFDLKISREKLAALSEPGRSQFLNYAYLNIRTGNYILCFDDARFFNHADEANCISTDPTTGDEEGIDIAARDIRLGEELTNNYREFDDDFNKKMGE